MKKILLCLALLWPSLALAQFGPPTSVGGLTREVCASPTVSASAAYTANTVIGGLITLSNVFRTQAQGAPDQGGILQSLRLIFRSVQSAQFNIFQFNSNPDSTTWVNGGAPALATADAFKILPPIQLANPSTSLSANGVTVYGADAIGRAHVMSPAGTTSDYFVIITTGTPTFSATSEVQLCATYLLD